MQTCARPRRDTSLIPAPAIPLSMRLSGTRENSVFPRVGGAPARSSPARALRDERDGAEEADVDGDAALPFADELAAVPTLGPSRRRGPGSRKARQGGPSRLAHVASA